MKKAIQLTTLFFFLFFIGCKKNEILKNQEFSSTNKSSNLECQTAIDLIAGQHFNAGDIVISNDSENIYVTFTTQDGWVLTESHLFVGLLEELPLTPLGNPKIGLFPFSTSHDQLTNYTYTIPIEDDLECYTIAAHAKVDKYIDGTLVQSETAWGEGEQISNTGSWAMQSEYCLLDCCEFEVETFSIYGGQTIESGQLHVTNDEDSLYVTYSLENGWSTYTTHLYVGNLDNLPVNGTNTPIPGQFPYSIESTIPLTEVHYSIPLDELNDCYIIAAHTELVLIDSGEIIQEETGWSFGTPFPNTNRWGWYSEYCTQSCE